MKETSTYIFETMFGKFHCKFAHGHSVDIAREIADNAIGKMKNVKLKSQKLVKCGHIWVALYKEVVSDAAKSSIINVEELTDKQSQNEKV